MSDGYTFGEFHVEPGKLEGLRAYVLDGIEPGGFLCAVIANDLRRACELADPDSLRNLPAFVSFLYSHAPASCWGSYERLIRWVERGTQMREGTP